MSEITLKEKENCIELFENIDDGDELSLESEAAIRNFHVESVQDRDEFSVGDIAEGERIVINDLGEVELKNLTSTGLETRGRKVQSIVNVTKGEWAGEQEFVDRYIRSEER